MNKTNFGFLSACLLASAPFSVFAGTTDSFCFNDSSYPVHRDRVCNLEKWVKNQQVPTQLQRLNTENSASLLLQPEDLAGELLLRQNAGVLEVSKRYQNCKDVYESFRNQAHQTAGTIECKAGPNDFVPSSHYGSGNYCSVSGNIETCYSSKLTLAPDAADISQIQPVANYSGNLVKTTRKNELSYRQGYIPVSNGGITFFVKGTVTDRKQTSLVNQQLWTGSIKSPVNPTPYFELTCVGETRVDPVTISLTYRNANMTQVGFLGGSLISAFDQSQLKKFKQYCTSNVRLSLVNHQDIATGNWSFNFERTGGSYIDELVRFGEQLLKDANYVIAEHNTLQKISTNTNVIKQDILAEVNVNWNNIASTVTVHDFFNAGAIPQRYQGEAYKNILVANTELSVTGDDGQAVPNFALMAQLVEELKGQGISAIGQLFNFSIGYLYDDYFNQKYSDEYLANWDSMIVLSHISGLINDENNDNTIEDLVLRIESLKQSKQEKVQGISAVIEHFLYIVSIADAAEVEKLNELRNKLEKL
ncbi:hypothetical protein [Photobacterium sp. R1]